MPPRKNVAPRRSNATNAAQRLKTSANARRCGIAAAGRAKRAASEAVDLPMAA
jgi:hypothetical protein